MRSLLLVVLVFFSLATSGCSEDNRGTESDLIPTKEFTIISKQFSFEPSTIEVRKGDVVKLTVIAADVAHGIAIPAFGVNKNIAAGQTAEIVFVADKEGEFPFVCSVYCGTRHGSMRGVVIVE